MPKFVRKIRRTIKRLIVEIGQHRFICTSFDLYEIKNTRLKPNRLHPFELFLLIKQENRNFVVKILHFS